MDSAYIFQLFAVALAGVAVVQIIRQVQLLYFRNWRVRILKPRVGLCIYTNFHQAVGARVRELLVQTGIDASFVDIPECTILYPKNENKSYSGETNLTLADEIKAGYDLIVTAEITPEAGNDTYACAFTPHQRFLGEKHFTLKNVEQASQTIATLTLCSLWKIRRTLAYRHTRKETHG